MPTATRHPARLRPLWHTQLAMCILLLLSVLLAWLVVQHYGQSLYVALDAPVALGQRPMQLVAALPRGWTVRSEQAWVVAEDSSASPTPRQIRLLRSRRGGFISPVQFLHELDAIPHDALVRPLRVAGWPGVLLTSRRSAIAQQRLNRVVAAAALPSGDVLVVQAVSPPDAEVADEHLVSRIAQTLEVRDLLPPAPAGGEFQLTCGISLAIPERFVTMPVDDPFRTGLRFGAEEREGWLGLELVPCAVPAGEAAQTLQTMLASRDPQAPLPAVRPAGEGCWVAQQSLATSLSSVSTYLLVHPDGRALLAQFRSDAARAPEIDQAWETLAASVRFGGQGDLTHRWQRGAAAAALVGAQSNALLAEATGHQRWLWYDDSPQPRRRWSTISWRPGPQSLEAVRQTDLSSDASPPVVQSRWKLSSDLRDCEFWMQSPGPWGQQFHRHLRHLALDAAPTTSPTTGTLPAAAQWVPEVLLPLLLARTGDQPMLLRTESSWLAEGAAAPVPLVLWVQESTDLPRRLDGSPQPMRCLSVSLNGTGESTRWYFDPPGQLRYIDLAAGRHLQREQ